MDKLVALHFPAPVVEERPLQLKPSNPLAQMAEIGGSLRGKTAKDLWRSVAGGKSDAELAEQTIVKWQDDASVARCPICSVSFGLKTRRHHCRLCGRVVCFLPPAPPTRPERCSTFFTYEYDDRIGTEKKPQGVIVELEQVEQDLSLGAVVKEGAAPVREKDEREKVRICRDCLDVVLRHQEATLPQRTPTWVKLYEVLVQLESSISTALPEFEELVLGLKQEALVQGYVEDANARRQFEDAASLKASLSDLREEIARVRAAG
ncbi:hypothetical protein RQP46_000959 [Phenoliferia psychrophenolica]